MVKSLTCVLLSTLLLLGAALFEWFYVQDEFDEFSKELTALAGKTEAQTANEQDAKAVQTSWEKRKKKLHVWIPHNDISRIDEYMAESVKLIGEACYPLALSKIHVVLHLTKCLPGTYRPALENIL